MSLTHNRNSRLADLLAQVEYHALGLDPMAAEDFYTTLTLWADERRQELADERRQEAESAQLALDLDDLIHGAACELVAPGMEAWPRVCHGWGPAADEPYPGWGEAVARWAHDEGPDHDVPERDPLDWPDEPDDLDDLDLWADAWRSGANDRFIYGDDFATFDESGCACWYCAASLRGRVQADGR